MNDGVEKIYDNTKSIIEKKFFAYERDEILKSYKDYLYSRYGKFNNIEKGLDKLCQLEIKFFENKDKNYIKSLIIKDYNYEELCNLSKQAKMYALSRINDNLLIDANSYNDIIKSMNKIFDKIKPYNKNAAKMVYSEAIVDLEFAAGLTDNTSLRVGRMNRSGR